MCMQITYKKIIWENIYQLYPEIFKILNKSNFNLFTHWLAKVQAKTIILFWNSIYISHDNTL